MTGVQFFDNVLKIGQICQDSGPMPQKLFEKKKQEKEIFHNKIYLFNTQTMENNIKKLKESLMQKTHFLQKHETIDNMQKATKYNLIRSSYQFSNEKKKQSN